MNEKKTRCPSHALSTRAMCLAKSQKSKGQRCGQRARIGSAFCQAHSPVWQIEHRDDLRGHPFYIFDSNGNYVRPFNRVQYMLSATPEMLALLTALDGQTVIPAEVQQAITRIRDHIAKA